LTPLTKSAIDKELILFVLKLVVSLMGLVVDDDDDDDDNNANLLIFLLVVLVFEANEVVNADANGNDVNPR
jgi:hypothetical protein